MSEYTDLLQEPKLYAKEDAHQRFRRLLIERIEAKTSWGKNVLKDLINEVYAEVF